MPELESMEVPDAQAIQADALRAGGLDPMALRFRIVEYCKSTGRVVGVPAGDLGFPEAVERTKVLIERNANSEFCLEPIGFLQ